MHATARRRKALNTYLFRCAYSPYFLYCHYAVCVFTSEVQEAEMRGIQFFVVEGFLYKVSHL